ncbi:hypothetical protein Btru_010550 [Bulinus truncatus]|nr:hypothetical protein Btru_010550 [Bulinus truncatus]
MNKNTHGLILKLKDKATSLEDKIKLSTFAWTSENVCIPNKHQNILDFFCGLLINKKKHNLQDKDVVIVWKTLDKFFPATGSTAIIKPSFLQAIIESLNIVNPGCVLSSGTEYIGCVLRCTKQFLLSQSVSVSHFDALCLLVGTICQLLLTVKTTAIQSDLRELLDCSIKVLVKCHRSHLNKAQALHTLSEKFLKPSLELLSVQSCPILTEFLINCLLSEEQHEQCATYLSQAAAEGGQPSKKSVPKSILNFFTLVSSHCLKIESSSLFIFIPEFLKAFVQHKSTTPRQCFLMLKHLVSLIVSTREVSGDEHLWLTRSVLCLEVCQDTDIFCANSDGNDILKWFFQLTELVLEQKRSCSWFKYMRSVLILNHLVVEKYWMNIFSKSFSLEPSEEIHNDLDMFMSDLVQTYVKLRRTSDLLSTLLSCLTDVTETLIYLRKLTHFYCSLCQMFTAVPQATMLELWEKVQSSAEAHIQQSSADIAPGLHWTLALYACLLENARLVDHRTGDVLHRRVCGLIKSLELNILQVLVKRKAVAKLPPVKELLQAYTVVRILLFPRWREEVIEEQESGEREKIFTKIVKVLEPSLQVHLSVQRVNLASFTGIKCAADLMAEKVDVEEVASRLLDLPPLNKKLVFEPWDQNVCLPEGVSASQHAVLQFQQFAQIFPLISHKLPDRVLDRCGQFIVDVLCVAEADNCPTEPGQTNLLLEVKKFLSHPSTREVARLHKRIVLPAWQKIFNSCQKNPKHSPKKRKLNSDRTEVVQYLTGEIDQIHDQNVTSKDLRMDLTTKPYFKLLISTLSHLDLEYLPLVNLKYQLGLLLMLGSLQQKDTTDFCDIQHCVKVDLIKALSVPNLSGLFSCIDPTELLSFIVEVCGEDVGETLHCQLIQTVLYGILNDHDSVIKMAEYTKLIVNDLSNGSLDPVKLKILADTVKFCQKYVTKSFHIPAVHDSALSIYFMISKLLIKHGLKWFTAPHCPLNNSQVGGEVKGAQSGRQNKRKRSSKGFIPNPNGSGTVLECVSEVLTIWSVHVADVQSNSHLEMMVKTMIDKLMQDPQLIQETETKFLEASCLCQLRCQENGDPSSESPGSRKLCFLTESRLEEIFDIFIYRCTDKVRDIFQQIRKDNSRHENLNNMTPILHTLSSPTSDNVSKDGTTSINCSLETMVQWPASLAADMQLLMSAMVCLDKIAFSRTLQKLLTKLVYTEPDECPGFYVVTSLWRQLISSPLLPPSLVKLLFHNIYEFLLSHAGLWLCSQSLHPEMALIQKFVLDSLSDFVDLGKMQVSSRMILLCLDAGVAFTVASVEDVRALYRLTNTLLVYHTNTTLTSVAGIVSLVSSCIKLGGQQHTAVSEVMTCAQLTSRLLTLLSSTSCKAELNKVAHLIVAEYILGVQEENLHPLVKNELVKGVYKIMSICDKFRFASLTASLPPGTKETFKVLHQDFNKYHRYSGLV